MMQSLSLASSNPYNVSASSVSAEPHLLLKSSGGTEEVSRNIVSNEMSSKSGLIARKGGDLSKGGKGLPWLMMANF